MSSSSNRIVELSAIIHENSIKIDEFMTANGLPSPSFDIFQPPVLHLPPHIDKLRQAVIDASDELKALMLGPISTITHTHIQLANIFPATETFTFASIAQASSLPESDVRRILRHAMTHYIFREPTPGVVAHTALSKAFIDIPLLSSLVSFIAQELWMSSTRLVDAMVKWPGSEEPNQAGFNLAHSTELPMFELIESDSPRAQQMSGAMALMHGNPGWSIKYVLDNFSWGAAAQGVLVDVGGGTGTITAEMARYHPEMKCIVQDLPAVIGGAVVPEDMKDGERLRFMAHDFFAVQPVKEADVYMLRWILHDWSDKYALRILQNIIPALKPGARILVLEQCLPEPCVLSPYQEREARSHDLTMMEIQNAKERDAEEWAILFAQVDPSGKLKFEGVEKPEGSVMSMISAVWTG